MLTVEPSLLSTLLSLAAAFLSFSVAVQIFQELWKYLTSSKSRAYLLALRDFLGPWTNDFLREFGQSSMRGPFQLFRFKPGKNLLPMNREGIAAGLERMAPTWVHRTMEAIRLEMSLQGFSPQPPSALWKGFVGDLAGGRPAADDVRQFLEEWGHRFGSSSPAGVVSVKKFPAQLDARQLFTAFRRRFYRDHDSVLERFPSFERNFEYAYKRRNLRQSFTIALAFAFFFDLPFDVLYSKASTASPDQATALVENAISLYDRSAKDSIGVFERRQLLADATQAVGGTLSVEGVDYLVDLKSMLALWNSGFDRVLRHLLGLLITALLASFGAPFWNDLISVLSKVRPKTPSAAEESA
jgi:hypothetical protein